MSEIVSASAPTGGITWGDHLGKLLIVKPQSYEAGVTTVNGVSDAIRGDVYVLTGPDTAEEYVDTFLWGKLLVSQLKNQIGNTVVGRVGQGAAQPGKNPPWLLEAATPDDIEKARAYLAKTAAPAVTAAAAPF